MGDPGRGLRQQRSGGGQASAGVLQVRVAHQRADPDGAVLDGDAVQAGEVVEVDQVLGREEAGVHHRDQALPAGERLGVEAVLVEQGQGLLQPLGPVVARPRHGHGRSGPAAAGPPPDRVSRAARRMAATTFT